MNPESAKVLNLCLFKGYEALILMKLTAKLTNDVTLEATMGGRVFSSEDARPQLPTPSSSQRRCTYTEHYQIASL